MLTACMRPTTHFCWQLKRKSCVFSLFLWCCLWLVLFSRTVLWLWLNAAGSSTPAAQGHHLPAIETSLSCHSLPVVKNRCGDLYFFIHIFSWNMYSVIPYLCCSSIHSTTTPSVPTHLPSFLCLVPVTSWAIPHHFPGGLFFYCRIFCRCNGNFWSPNVISLVSRVCTGGGSVLPAITLIAICNLTGG